MPTTALVDIDSFFDPAWNETLGDRVFRFDAFLSHNRNDDSATLKAQLEQAEIKASLL